MKYKVLVALACLVSSQADGHEEGDWIIKAGPISVQPSVDSDPVDVAGLETLANGVDVGNEVQLGLTGVYMLTDRWGIELLAASPFSHEIKLKDVPLNAGDTKQLPPTLSLQYYPAFGSETFNPFIGLGLNNTIFFEERVSDDLNSALDGIVSLPEGSVDAELDLDNSVGLAAQVGLDYMITENILINGTVWWMDIDTEATIYTSVANVTFDVDIDPFVYLLSIGYRF